LHAQGADIVIQDYKLLMISPQCRKTLIGAKATGMNNLLNQYPELLPGEVTRRYLPVHQCHLIMTFNQPIKNRSG